jgi:type IV secretory pathway VirB10-like protein
MNNDYKTSVVEPAEQRAAVIEESAEDSLATQALEDIRNTERLSGFGRFATKMQGFFQASKPSQAGQQSPHLKAVPIMMSAGLLLLLATGLLFLLSKPESSVHSHFRTPTGLSGADDRKPISASSTDSPVTENQLVGGGASRDSQAVNRDRTAARPREDGSGHRFSFADEPGPSNGPSMSQNPAAVSELQNPATVFVANPSATPVLNLPFTSHEQRTSSFPLPSGTEIIAHTTNAISSGLESPVIAVVDRNVQLGNSVVVPQGARVIGYTAGAVKDRINVRFTSLVLPSNREVTISGLALMKDGSAGLVGRVQGSGHPVLATATRIGTGAAVVATEFAGAGSLNQPFSQADYLRNQMAYEIASEGSRYSNRLQQPTSVPIVNVNTNQSIRIFLLNALIISEGRIQDTKPPQQTDAVSTLTAEKDQAPDQSLAAAQTAYIQALESQLADMHAALDAKKSNGHN